MKLSSPPGRIPVKLSESVRHRLNMYALAASAAGVGMLALAQPAEAKIVYTAAHMKIGPFDKVVLDLNHDGTGDFRFYAGGEGTTGFDWQYLFADRYRSGMNGVLATNTQVTKQAVALRAGARIGPSGFFNGFNSMARHFTANNHTQSTFWVGQWANGGKGVKNRYLGLKFLINGKFHFGWARVTFTVIGNNSYIATLTSYAYETIPNKSIIAGSTKGPDAIDNTMGQTNPAALTAPTPATLGMLAMGSPGLSIWRRKDSGEPAQ
jgi:hypothetical protein